MREKIEELKKLFKDLWGKRPKGIPVPKSGKLNFDSLPDVFGKFNLAAMQNSFQKIDWEKLYRKSFLYNSVVVVICAYFIADFAVIALSPWYPASEAPRARMVSNRDKKDITRYDGIYARNLFNEKGLIPEADDGGAGYNGPPVRTSLPLSLLGVIVVQDQLKSVASVEDKGANQVVAVRVNEQIAANAIVQKIENDRVIFINKNTERREYVELPKDAISATRRAAPSKPSAGQGIVNAGNNRFAIDRKEVDSVLSNFNEVLTQARCIPNFEGGKPNGYKCFQIVPGSIYDKLGMKDGDVICGINGESVNDPAKAFQLLGALKDQSTRSIALCLSRNGQIMNMQYDIN